MNNRFALRVLAGVSSIAIALPLFASSANAASPAKIVKPKAVPTVACVQAMANEETLQIANIDAQAAARKAALQAHVDALTAAAAITDDTQRAAAIAQADSDMNKAMQAMLTSSTNTDAINAMRTACGKGGMIGQIDSAKKKWHAKVSTGAKNSTAKKKTFVHAARKKSANVSSASR